MTLTANQSIVDDVTICETITIDSTLLNSFIAAPGTYTKVEVIGTFNCTTVVTKTYSSTALIGATGDVITVAGVEKINPSMFSTTSFSNGVFGFTVKLYPLSGVASTDSGCIFVDNTVACTICTEDLQSMMYHYILTESQDCGCDCQKLCDMYSLIKLNNSETEDCNC